MISNNTRHSLLPLLPVTRVLPNNALSFPELIILQKPINIHINHGRVKC